MEQQPLISVLMPVYNAGAFLAPAVRSILEQTFGDFELIIIDDGSTDRSLEVLRNFEQQDVRIRLLSRQNTGYVAALNELLAMARGQLIARMDADDIAHPGRFRQQVEFLRDNPGIICVGSAFDIIDEHSVRLTRLRPPSDDAEIQQLLLQGHTAICHPSAMIRESALRDIGGYDESLTSVEDLDVFLKLGEIGLLANLPRALLRYRIHSGSVSARSSQRQRELARTICERAWARRGITSGDFRASGSWRPGPDRQSRHEFALRYGWWAFMSGQRRAATRYARQAVTLRPWDRSGWSLLSSALVKPRPVQPSDRPDAPARSDSGDTPTVTVPTVTVLMPCYNAEPYLREAVESIIDQTFADFEFVIVNDGSTDHSPEILHEYANADPRLRILSRDRAGYVSALNYGLEHARGRYIARMDADDIADPRRFEAQVERFEQDLDLVAVGSCALAIDPRGRPLGPFDVPGTHEEIEQAHLAGVSSIHHPAVMMRRNALDAAGRYREGFAPAEDFDLWLRLGEVGRLENLHQRLICKRLTTSGVVGSTLWLQRSVIRWALEDAWKRRALDGKPPQPDCTLQSEADLYRQWGWLAVRHRSLSAARLYAARAIVSEPLHQHSWRLAYCAMRGR